MSKASSKKIKEALTILSEECGEVIVECSKYQRFGNKIYRDQTALERLEQEIGDLLCMIEILNEQGVISEERLVAAAYNKRMKLKKWSKLID